VNTTPPEPEQQPEPPTTKTCWCVIAHAITPAQRDEVNDAIAYARSIGDMAALPLLLARLTGSCPARG
jgi:hypothetical protein